MKQQGLRTVIYGTADLDRSKEFYTRLMGVAPYFDEPFYVGFNLGGFELGLDPDAPRGPGGATAYWAAEDVTEVFRHALECGASALEEPKNVGGEMWVCCVADPDGNRVGFIFNPHFRLPEEG